MIFLLKNWKWLLIAALVATLCGTGCYAKQLRADTEKAQNKKAVAEANAALWMQAARNCAIATQELAAESEEYQRKLAEALASVIPPNTRVEYRTVTERIEVKDGCENSVKFIGEQLTKVTPP